MSNPSVSRALSCLAATAACLFAATSSALDVSKPDEAYKILEDMLVKVPQSYDAYFAWKWLSERDAKK